MFGFVTKEKFEAFRTIWNKLDDKVQERMDDLQRQVDELKPKPDEFIMIEPKIATGGAGSVLPKLTKPKPTKKPAVGKKVVKK